MRRYYNCMAISLNTLMEKQCCCLLTKALPFCFFLPIGRFYYFSPAVLITVSVCVPGFLIQHTIFTVHS